MPNPSIRLVAGLGNPGDPYGATRHNAGFWVLDALASLWGIAWKSGRHKADWGRGRVEGADVVLVKPLDYMNRSGPPLRAVADYFRIPLESILVVHDDIDLAFGRLKITEKGGHGGHKGVKSIMDVYGAGGFARLRVGVGRPEPGRDVTGHVLGRLSEEERRFVDDYVGRAREAVETVLSRGTVEGMNRFNDKRAQVSAKT